MSLITINNLTFAYDGTYDNIFENVSLTLDSNQRVGLVARNGRGKTTLLRLLNGDLDSNGSISASIEFEYFPYTVADEAMPALDLVCSVAGLSREAEEWLAVRELRLLDVPEDAFERPFATLSGGERAKVQLAALFLKGKRYLVIDEPTKHVDMEGRRILGQYLKGKRGFILVSHDRTLLDDCTTHTLSINRSGIAFQRGSFSVWEQNKNERDALEIAKNERLGKEIGRLETAMERGTAWADKVEARKIGSGPCDRGYVGAKSAAMMRHAKAVQTRVQRSIEEKEGLMWDVERSPALKLHPLEHYSHSLAEFADVAVAYGGREVFSGLSFEVKNGDRISVCGKNGSGKSTLIKLLLGENIPHTGTVRIAPNLIISYVPQETAGLGGSLYGFAEESGIDVTLFLTILSKLGFPRLQFEKEMEKYSAGQRKKVFLARSLCEKAHLYVWDEPLNYIDVLSRIQIEALIQEFRPTLLFVEHDRAFVDKLATRTIGTAHGPFGLAE